MPPQQNAHLMNELSTADARAKQLRKQVCAQCPRCRAVRAALSAPVGRVAHCFSQLAEVNELKLKCANLEDALAEKADELAQQRGAVGCTRT